MSSISAKLRETLRSQVRQMEPGAILPGDRELAEKWSVSLRTVANVMRQLASEGLVTRYQGKGTVVGGGTEVKPVSPRPVRQTSVEALAESLQETIRSGVVKDGEALPSAKHLCHQYRVSASTVTKAYSLLVKNGVATKVGNRYWAGPFGRERTLPFGKEVFLFTEGTKEFEAVLRNDILSHSYLTMHRELAAHGFVLRFETFERLPSCISEWKATQKFPYGAVLFRIYSSQGEKALEQLIEARHFAGKRSGVTINLLADQRKFIGKVKRGSNVLYRSTLTTAVARQFAAYVRSRNLKRIRFFFDSSQYYDQVSGYSWYSLWQILKIKQELLKASTETAFDIVVQTPYKELTAEEFVDKQIDTVPGGMQTQLLSNYRTDRDALVNMSTVVQDFHKALIPTKSESKVAWLFSTDEQASEALKWARERRMTIPRDISVVGLQKNPTYLPDNITTIEPDWTTIGYLMAHALIGDIALTKTSKGYLQMPAIVYEGVTS